MVVVVPGIHLLTADGTDLLFHHQMAIADALMPIHIHFQQLDEVIAKLSELDKIWKIKEEIQHDAV